MITDTTQAAIPKEKPPKPSTDAETSVSPSKPPTGVEPQCSSKTSTNDAVTSDVSKYRKSGPPDGPVAKAKAKAAPPWRQELPKSKKHQKRQQTADRKSSIPNNAASG